jgi:AbrB family looped-hinge helix DNA binding protein
MSLIEMKTATITSKGQISIPAGIRDSGFKEGSKVAVLAYKDRIEIRPIKQLKKAIETVLASENALSKDWNSKEEDEAWQYLQKEK